MQIKVLSRREAEEYTPEGSAVCISINERDMAFAEIPIDRYESILRLIFDDIDDGTIGGGFIPFETAHAKKILEFVEKYKNEVDELVIHCTVGVSRSPGVALGLMDYYGKDTKFFEKRFSLHNRKVRRTFLNLKVKGNEYYE